MTRKIGHRLLHSPGPTHLPEAVLQAMHRQPVDLADPELDEVVADCLQGLADLLGKPDAVVTMFAANAHGAWEATAQNILAPGMAVLIPETGHFSQSWSLQTRALGHEVIDLPGHPGTAIDPERLEAALRADRDHRIAAVFLVHTDTASGTTNDLAALRAAMDAANHPALMVVDVVASLAADEFDMAALRVNVAVGGSQKGLMMPPGLSFMAVDEHAIACIKANPRPRFYWDWERRQGALAYQKLCGTPPEHLLFGLQAALALLRQEGHAQTIRRHRRHAEAVHAAVQAWSTAGALTFFTENPASRSVSVTAIQTAAGIDPEALRRVCREQFDVSIAGGNGANIGRVFRIGHLGDMNAGMLLGCLAAVQGAMAMQGIAYGPGAMDAAIERLSRQE